MQLLPPLSHHHRHHNRCGARQHHAFSTTALLPRFVVAVGAGMMGCCAEAERRRRGGNVDAEVGKARGDFLGTRKERGGEARRCKGDGGTEKNGDSRRGAGLESFGTVARRLVFEDDARGDDDDDDDDDDGGRNAPAEVPLLLPVSLAGTSTPTAEHEINPNTPGDVSSLQNIVTKHTLDTWHAQLTREFEEKTGRVWVRREWGVCEGGAEWGIKDAWELWGDDGDGEDSDWGEVEGKGGCMG